MRVFLPDVRTLKQILSGGLLMFSVFSQENGSGHRPRYLHGRLSNRTATDSSRDRGMQVILEEGITHLTAELRDAVLLHDVAGMSTEEAAEDLQLERAALRARLHEGRVFLRDYLEHAGLGGFDPLREAGA